MIAQIFKDVYSGQRTTGRRRATEQSQQTNIPRALPVEDDESD